jgi:uncharacterized protein DUF1236
MNKSVFVPALALALSVSGGAFAQSPTGAIPSSPPAAATPQKTATPRTDQTALTIDKLTQDLQKAGFTEVKVLEDAFLVQAKTKDGNSILMNIGANGISALEVSMPKAKALAKEPDEGLAFDTSPKDRTRIREIFGTVPAEVKVDHVDFSLSPGTVVPHSVHLAALPQTMVDIEPTWRGNEYFKVGERIVIVDSQSMKILGVLDA